MRRHIGPFDVSPLGLGCMSMSHAYGTPLPREEAVALLHQALDLGYTHLDTAALYGFGANETLIGEAVRPRRNEFMLASKGGMFRNEQGQRVIDGRPETIRAHCDASLQRLQTDVIDLYYLHRLDRNVPIEESVGAMADLVAQGKVRTLGLSEMSAATLRRAHRVHPITAMQTEYSLWTRDAEVGVLDACRELGVTFVAFSPVARGFLTDAPPDIAALPPKDIRLGMPRFYPEHYAKNLELLTGFRELAREQGCTSAQLALAWVLARDPGIVPIPGTTNAAHLKENFAAKDVTLDDEMMRRLDGLINPTTVSGDRYNPPTQAEIDTEQIRRNL